MANNPESNRRDFLKNTLVAGALSGIAPQLLYAKSPAQKSTGEGYTFLFQGDSITDGNRTRDNDWNHIMGHGYQYIIASKLWYDSPEKGFHIFNRGVSGNKVTDLAARWQSDTLDIRPDLLSILVGINDTSAFVYGNRDFTASAFEISYRNLLQQTKQQLPLIQLVLCEPFILPVGKVKEKWEDYSRELALRQAIVKRLSAETGAIFVDFQSGFNKALLRAPAEYWIWDGIHPMPAGHQLMATQWLKEVSKKVQITR